MTQAISKQEIKRIYALGAGAGLLDRDSRDDLLHDVVYTLTAKESISALTQEEFRRVERELLNKYKLGNHQAPLKKREPKSHAETPGGITADQQCKVWALMYALRDLDGPGRKAALGERLCGIIRKQLHRDCTPEQPFRFVTQADGWRLIEAVKGMVDTAKKVAL
ncbi:DUF1018 domain-containing protein [Christensenellaceae bacterium OttesenSCG-928-M15]|nr:DUF1018 domain-containing protein [Christensenellaceae bacterium OttesenSCG-928-M15]